MGALAQSSPTAAQDDRSEPVVEQYFTRAVQWMIDQNIAVDTTTGCFGPNVAATRGETALYLWRVSGKPTAPPHPFRDVTNETQQGAVSWLYQTKITTGTSPTTFSPNQTLTRVQLAALLHRLAGEPTAEGHPFSDVVANWQQAPVAWLLNNNITTGTSATTFAPNQLVTRGQLATFLYRYNNSPTVTLSQHRETCDLFSAVDSGDHHTCAVRKDNTIVCWGDNSDGQADAPKGQFASVSAGRDHTCAIRTDNTVTCWGAKGHGQTNAPEGQFTAIGAGRGHTCALRGNGTVACWGDSFNDKTDATNRQFTSIGVGYEHNCGLLIDDSTTCWGKNHHGEADAPNGKFSSVSAGRDHTCALRTDGTVACWGANWESQLDAPTGVYSQVSAGRDHTCAIGTDNTIACWGANWEHQSDAPSGEFTVITSGWEHSCGLRSDNTIACWGGDRWTNRITPPTGQFTAMSAGVEHSCAIRTDTTLRCWGSGQIANLYDPFGSFTSVSIGSEHTCAIRSNKTISCWGPQWDERTEAPNGQFTAISSGGVHSCAIGTNNTISCWGDSAIINQRTPVGSFSAVSAGEEHACALRNNGTLACWGNNQNGKSNPPAGRFRAVSAGGEHSCAIRTNGTIACWGANWGGQTNPPNGQFTEIDAGRDHTCAIRADGTVICWGSEQSTRSESFVALSAGALHSCGILDNGEISCWSDLLSASPTGVSYVVEYDAIDPTKCRPPGVSGVTAGFPLSPKSVKAKGTVRVAVLFMDFPNAQATHSTQIEAELGLTWAESYLEAQSYGLLDVEFVPLHRWLRAPNAYQHYLVSDVLGRRSLATAASVEAVRLADPEVDFSSFESVMVVTPSSHFNGGNASFQIDTDEGSVAGTSMVGDQPRTLQHEPQRWGGLAAHELLHNLGLLDMYPYDPRDEPPALPDGKVWLQTWFGLMGLRVDLPAEPTDRNLRVIWIHPSGYQGSSFVGALSASEMLAWSRWQLGWLDSAQVRCVTEKQATVVLDPVAVPGDNLAMAAIPVSATEVIVIESRRKIAYDAPVQETFPDDLVAKAPTLTTEGVLVYTVDTSLGSGQLPIKVAQDNGNGRTEQYPILAVGQSVTINGYTITVESGTDITHTVTITRSSDDPK